MKILLSADTVGGVWDHTVTLARELHRAGHSVLVATIGEPRDERLAALPAGVEVTWRPYRLEWMPDAAADVAAAAEWLRHNSGLWAADVVHLNQFAYAIADFAAPVLLAAHSDVLSWWSEARGLPAPPQWTEYARWVRDGLAAADLVVAPTAYQSALLGRSFGRSADRVVFNGGVPPDEPPPPRDEMVVVTAGRAWDAAKGVAVLDRAVGSLRPGPLTAHLLGETVAPHGERYTPEHLVAHGRVERAEVDAWMRRASVYVAPSLYEPFGLAPLEAAFQNCALLLSDIGSFRELWDGCALFFPRGNAPALARALAELQADPARRTALAVAARKRAECRYTAARMASEYSALYHRLAGAPLHAGSGA